MAQPPDRCGLPQAASQKGGLLIDQKPARRILITGGSGFIGTNLVEAYHQLGWEVLNLDVLPPRNPAHSRFWQQVDLCAAPALQEAVVSFSPEIILHCAARTDLKDTGSPDGYRVNTEGTSQLIQAVREAQSVQRMIFFSSQLVCPLGYTPEHDLDFHPVNAYGRSKAEGEKIVRLASDFCPTWVIVRPTSIYGPWFDVPYRNFFNAILRGVYFHPRGVQILKQWGFVGNTVHQVSALVEAPSGLVHRKMFYLADYTPVELGAFARQVQAATNAPPVRTLPVAALKFLAAVGDGLMRLGWADPPLTRFRLHNILTPELQALGPLREIAGELPYTLQQGIELTTAWLKQS